MAAAKTKIVTPKDENNNITSGMRSLFTQLKQTANSLQDAAAAYNTHYKGIKRLQSIRENENPTFGMTKAEAKKYKEEQKKKAAAKRNPNSWANTAKRVAPQQQNHVADALVGSMLGIDPAILQSFGLTGLSKKAISSTFNLGMGVAKRASKFAGNAIGAGARLFYSKKDQEKQNKKANSEEVGSAINASEDKTTGILKNILKVFKNKDKNDKKEKEKEKKSGLNLGGLLGRVALAGIGGLLLSAARPLIKRLISNMFEDLGMPSIGGALGQVIADMLPGAVMGFTLMKSVKGALIGAAVSLSVQSFKRIVEDFKNTGSGEIQIDQNENYLSSAMRGAFLGYVFGGKSLKAALLGAGISMGITWITNRVDDFKRIANGEVVAPKMLGPFPEAVAGGVISGAMLGSKFGGVPGALWGAVIGGAVGGLFAAVTDFQSRLNHAEETGEYVASNLTVAGIPIDIFNGMLMGGIGGFMAGGPLGAFAGALVGGAAGWIYGKIKDGQIEKKADEKKGMDALATNPELASQKEHLNQVVALKDRSKTIEAQRKELADQVVQAYISGRLSHDQYKQAISQLQNADSSEILDNTREYRDSMKDIMRVYTGADLNNDGIVFGDEELGKAEDILDELDGTFATRWGKNSRNRFYEVYDKTINEKKGMTKDDVIAFETQMRNDLGLNEMSELNQHSMDQLTILEQIRILVERVTSQSETHIGSHGISELFRIDDKATTNTGTNTTTNSPIRIPASTQAVMELWRTP